MVKGISFKQTQAYQSLWKHAERLKKTHLIELFQNNPSRVRQLSVCSDHLYYDYSRQLVDESVIENLISLAAESNLREKISAMFNGEKINRTENRAVLHTALRNLSDSALPLKVDNQDVRSDVKKVLEKVKIFSEEVLTGKRLGVTGKKIKNIVALGIGGSYLGPEYLAVALRPYARQGMKLVFVANVDGTDFIEKTEDLNPEETMVVIISKTFTTAETMKNAATAKKWIA
ncbi:MAG: glucose-6-phosphate isomerase, partial [Candidatus Margulisiibacteriota bacterium]